MTVNAFRSWRLAVAAVLFYLANPAAAAPPVEVPSGNLVIVRSASAERWFVHAHDGKERSVLVITVAADGGVTMETVPLPDSQAPQDPDDPSDPLPTQTLTQLVRQWSVEVNDPTNRAELAAAYEATATLVTQGKIPSIDLLVSLQRLANTTVLGADAAKWSGFFAKLGQWLDANTPANLDGYKTRWLEISAGLKE